MADKVSNKAKYRRKLIKKLDTVFSKWIRNRDKKCVICGSMENLQNSHLIRRGVHSVRFDEENCSTNCASHNFLHNIKPEIYTMWFIRTKGLSAYIDLTERSSKIKKWTIEELEEMIRKYA